MKKSHVFRHSETRITFLFALSWLCLYTFVSQIPKFDVNDNILQVALRDLQTNPKLSSLLSHFVNFIASAVSEATMKITVCVMHVCNYYTILQCFGIIITVFFFQVKSYGHDLTQLSKLLSLVRCLIENQSLFLEPYVSEAFSKGVSF